MCRACSPFSGVSKEARSGPSEVPRSPEDADRRHTLSLHLLQRMALFLDCRTVTVFFPASSTISALTGTCVICLPLNFRRNHNLNPDMEVRSRGLAKGGACTGFNQHDRISREGQSDLWKLVDCPLWGSGSIHSPPEWVGILRGSLPDE